MNCAGCGRPFADQNEHWRAIRTGRGLYHEECFYRMRSYTPKRTFNEVLCNDEDQRLVRDLLQEVLPEYVKAQLVEAFNREMGARWLRRAKLRQHQLHRCGEPSCFLCVGGLADCIVCGGAEITLPTECPGEPMTDEQMNAVRNQILDFRNGKWQPVLFDKLKAKC